jgi:hypothetical protein
MLPLSRRSLASRRNQAAAMALGLSAEVLSVEDVLAWAGAPGPEDAEGRSLLGAIATGPPGDVAAVARNLRALPGHADEAAAEALLVHRLLEVRREEPARAEAMLAKLVLSYRLHDPALRAAFHAHHRARALDDYYGRPVVPGDQRRVLVQACEDFVERTVGDVGWLDALPPWVRS